MDFSRLNERLDAAQASFVSVTQSFNTATSMGRLTLNVLLSFAQFEREVTAERIRDKIAASKKKGMWMGGPVPLGYRTEDTNLIVRDDEAETVRLIYDLYQEHQTVKALKQAADKHGLVSRSWVTKSGKPMGGEPYSRGHLYRILTNPIYAGKVSHKGHAYDGLHQGIIAPEQWRSVQDQLVTAAAKPRQFQDKVPDQIHLQTSSKSGTEASLLIGKLFDETGDRLTPSHANKKGKRYRYYVSNRLISKSGEKPTKAKAGGWRLPAKKLEETVCIVIRDWLNNPAQVLKELHPVNPSAEQLEKIKEGITNLNGRLSNASNDLKLLTTTIVRVCLCDTKITIEMDQREVLELLALPTSSRAGTITNPNQLLNEVITISSPFEHRKRGVESKLMIGTNAATKSDQVLITNIAKAKSWLTTIKTGCAINEIAKNEGRSIKQIQRHLELASLSPKIVKMITEGTQPPELTSRQLIHTVIPMDWDQQDQKFGIN